MGILSLLGFGKRKALVKEYLDRDAQIVDVRMIGEFKNRSYC